MGFTSISASQVDGNPPNCQVAVGRTRILVATIWRVNLHDRTGKLLDSKSGKEFFKPPISSDFFDARALYNPVLNKFLVSGIVASQDTGGRTLQAMTFSGEPDKLDDSWTKTLFHHGQDYPSWGQNADGFFCTIGTPSGMLVRFFPSGTNDLVMLPGELFVGGVPMPSKSYDPESNKPIYLVRLKDSDRNKLRVFRAPSFASMNFNEVVDIAIPQIYLYNNARQFNALGMNPGTPNGDLCLRGRYMVFTMHSGLQNGALTVGWYLIDTNTMKLVTSGLTNTQPGVDHFNPAVVMNDKYIVLTYLESGPNAYPTMVTHVIERSSYAVVNRYMRQSAAKAMLGGRVGDYPGACLDPVDNSLWTVNQPQGPGGSPNYNWETWVERAVETADVVTPEPPIMQVSGEIRMTVAGVQRTLKFAGAGTLE